MSPRPVGGYHDEQYVLRNKLVATSRHELAALEVPEVQDRELDLLLGEKDGPFRPLRELFEKVIQPTERP